MTGFYQLRDGLLGIGQGFLARPGQCDALLKRLQGVLEGEFTGFHGFNQGFEFL